MAVDRAGRRLIAGRHRPPNPTMQSSCINSGTFPRSTRSRHHPGGPRPPRTMWRISREQLDKRYGQLTIGVLIDRY
jgi:hypothetical protein